MAVDQRARPSAGRREPTASSAEGRGPQVPSDHKFINLTGRKFGRIRVVSFAGKFGNRPRSFWNCVCDCGNHKVINGGSLPCKNGTRSCGCIGRESTSKRSRTHGMTRTPTWVSWQSIIQRCYDPKSSNYPRYGSRGIRMCERWRNSFESFLEDVGIRPSLKHSIDRINNDGNYEPENCRWSTDREQSRNRSTNKNITFNGKTQCVRAWEIEMNLKPSTIHARIKRGWSIERSISTP